jgi:hypothetical protein
VKGEVEQGIASVAAALAEREAVAPFFRIPGLLRSAPVEGYLRSRALSTWSADVVADDWRRIGSAEVVRRALARLDEKRKGILLLHDIQPATALALPELLRQLKARGYRIVQVVPAAKPAAPVPVAAVPAPQAAVVAAPAGASNTGVSPPVTKPAQQLVSGAEHAPAPAVPHEPVRPLAAGLKASRSVVTPGKLAALEPGDWPPRVDVPLPAAGGVGASAVARTGKTPDGRFQPSR